MRHSFRQLPGALSAAPGRRRAAPGRLAIVSAALASGTIATVTSTAALALLARREGKGPAQPLNATSHWLYGDEAAAFPRGDVDHTPIGLATHYAATIFWALFFEAWVARRPLRGGMATLGGATAVAALAATVDYTITPKRFTPGWEMVLSKGAMALVYAAMAAGFAGAAVTRARRR